MKVTKLSIHGSPNVGLFGFVTNKYALVGHEVSVEAIAIIKKTLGVPVHQISIAGTSLIGAFLNGTDEHVLVPSIAFPQEIARLDELRIPYTIIDTTLTCLGNNLAITPKGVYAHIEYTAKVIKSISEALNLPVRQGVIAETEAVGSCIVTNKFGGLIHREVSDEEQALVEQALGIALTPGTVNFGSMHVHSGILANDHGLIIGNLTQGPELAHIDRALGGIEG